MGKVKIRGIFATWTVADVAKSPEMVFRLKLERNPTHPFVPLSESSNKLILRMRSQQIFIGIITILAASALAVALYYTQGNESLRGGGSSIFSVPAFIGAWGFALVIFNVQVRQSATTSVQKSADQSIRMRSMFHRFHKYSLNCADITLTILFSNKLTFTFRFGST